MQKTRTYLDYNASAPIRADVLDSVHKWMAQPQNASSVHALGRAGRKIVEDARAQIGALVGIDAAQIIFNSGATEGNNTVLRHFAGEKILVSAIEHPSVLDVREDAIRIPVTQDGLVDLAALEALLTAHRPALVSVMMVNNETGVIQPIEEISALAHKHGALLHCDGVQAAGRIPIDMPAMGIDFLTLSAHKIGGPQGVGALALGLCGITPTLLTGGGQEKKARAGTENVAGIGGFGLAAQTAQEELAQFEARRALHSALEQKLRAINPQIIIHGQNAPRAANTTLMSLPGARSESLLMALDLEGIAVSNGSACTSGSVQPSHVLAAMGVDEKIAGATLRISSGWATTMADIDCFLNAFEKIHARLRDKETKKETKSA